MKVSELKKDRQVTVRINSKLKEKIERKGLSPQKVVDNYLNYHFKVDERLQLRERK